MSTPALAINDRPAADDARPATLLCVDDEPGILKALQRVFRRQPYTVLTAESGARALAILADEPVNLILSDMRMPQMSGAEFLREAAQLQPGAVRILLTGYSDLESTVSAVNEGRIFRYLSKPWNDEELRAAVASGLDLQFLEAEHRRLLALTELQNQQLREVNADLESRVEARTEQLRQSWQDTISVFSQMVESRELAARGHGRRVARLAHRMGRELGLPAAELQHVYLAALLHDVGKVALSDDIVRKPTGRLAGAERAAYEAHVTTGPAMLVSIPLLEWPCRLIRAHHERWDGQGFPDALAGDDIPLGARIIAVANAFDGLRSGHMLGHRHASAQAMSFLRQQAGEAYDPACVQALGSIIADQTSEGPAAELMLTTGFLKPGMVVVRDVISESGLLLLAADTMLSSEIISRLLVFEGDLTEKLQVTIRPGDA